MITASNHTAAITLPSHPESASHARRVLRDLGPGDGDVTETACLLVTELIANAVEHTDGTHIEVELAVDPETGEAWGSVADTGAGLPLQRSAAADVDPMAESGRGLALMHDLSTACGVERIPGGKRIWFHVADDALGAEPEAPLSA